MQTQRTTDSRWRTFASALLAAAGLLGLVSFASATRIADVARLDAQREEKLTGMGLVLGLPGTGDGRRFAPAARSLAQMLGHFGNSATLPEVGGVNNVAIVMLTATVPANGGRAGDPLDVHLTSVGDAQSLAGGRLFVTPMTGPLPVGGGVFALAEGAVVIEDEATPTVGRVENGAVLEQDLPKRFVRDGGFTLIIDKAHASWTSASNIAKVINDSEGLDGEEYAIAIDPRNVVVRVPPAELARPDSFISRIQRLPVPLVQDQARVRINERLGTIIITGDVEISPVVVSMNGLTISTLPGDPAVIGPGGVDPFAANPAAPREGDFVPIATVASDRQRAKLRDLVDALDALKVPAQDRIAILKELHETGKLHAKLDIE
jgi:flagellar P-ring protein precursor FlgI